MKKQVTFDNAYLAKLMVWLTETPARELTRAARLPKSAPRWHASRRVIQAVTSHQAWLKGNHHKTMKAGTMGYVATEADLDDTDRRFIIRWLVDHELLPENWTGDFKLHLVGREEA